MTKTEREFVEEVIGVLMKDESTLRVIRTLIARYERARKVTEEERNEKKSTKRKEKKEDNNIYINNNNNIYSSSLVLSSSEQEKGNKFFAKDMFDLWNRFAKDYDLPSVKILTTTRIKKFNARQKSFARVGGNTEEFWRKILFVISKSNWHLGDNKYNWKANFDWLIRNDEVIAKLMEKTVEREVYLK